jgi:hypothetical protein
MIWMEDVVEKQGEASIKFKNLQIQETSRKPYMLRKGKDWVFQKLRSLNVTKYMIIEKLTKISFNVRKRVN